MKIPARLVKPTALIASNDSAASRYQSLFEAAGYGTVRCASLSEAVKAVDEVLPHVILCDSFLPDGHAGKLYDHLRTDRAKRKIPLLVHITSKSPKDLTVLAKRTFAAFFSGEPLPKAFAAKLAEIELKAFDPPPYWIKADRLTEQTAVELRVRASLLGIYQGLIVFKTRARLGSRAAFRCSAAAPREGTAELVAHMSLKTEQGYYCLVPAEDAPAGVDWLHELPLLTPPKGAAVALPTPRPRRMLFCHADRDRFVRLKRFLQPDGIEVVHADNLRQAALLFKERPGRFGCIFLAELLGDPAREDWMRAFDGADEANRPPLIIGTGGTPPPSSKKIRFVKHPVDMKALSGLARLELDRPDDGELNLDLAAHAKSVVSCTLAFETRLLGFTESGVILEHGCEVLEGTELTAAHPFLQKIWKDGTKTKVDALAPVEGNPNLWRSRLAAPPTVGAKAAYWKDLQLRASGQKVDEPDDADEAADKPARSPFDANVLNVFIQAVYEVIEYYTGELPRLGQPEMKQHAAALPPAAVAGLSSVKGETVDGYTSLWCDPALIAYLAFRIAGVPKDEAFEDREVLREVMEQLCDQIFGKARLFLESAGYVYEVSLPKVSFGAEAFTPPVRGKPLIVIPFEMIGTSFGMDVCFATKGAQDPVRVIAKDPAVVARARKELQAVGLAAEHRLDGSVTTSPVLIDAEAAREIDRKQLAALAKSPRTVILQRGDADRAIGVLGALPGLRHVHGWTEGDDLGLLAKRLASGRAGGIRDVFLDPGVVREERVREYASDTTCLDALADFAATITRIPDFATTVRTCAWELLTNAFFDAPVDRATGARKHRGKRKTERLRLQDDEVVTLSYGHDGRRFAVGVRDPFGSLAPEDVVRSLLRCRRKGDDQVGTSPKGAGIGLYMIASAAPRLEFHVAPGRFTEIFFVIPIDVPPRVLDLWPRSIHFFTEEDA